MPQRIKKNKREYTAHFLDRGKWWVAWTDEVSGAVTQGRTLREARENLKDAIALMLEPVDHKRLPAYSKRLVHEVLVL